MRISPPWGWRWGGGCAVGATRRIALDGLTRALVRGDGVAHAKTLAKPAPKSWRNSQF